MYKFATSLPFAPSLCKNSVFAESLRNVFSPNWLLIQDLFYITSIGATSLKTFEGKTTWNSLTSWGLSHRVYQLTCEREIWWRIIGPACVVKPGRCNLVTELLKRSFHLQSHIQKKTKPKIYKSSSLVRNPCLQLYLQQSDRWAWCTANVGEFNTKP